MFGIRNLVPTIFMVILVVNCANVASVEVGLNDEGLFRGVPGQFVIRVLKIEAKKDEAYSVIWEGSKLLTIPAHTSSFTSITEQYVNIDPGSYKTFRITVDSLVYTKDATNAVLLYTTYQFDANAFSNIIFEADDEHKLVVNIASEQWFDMDSLKIKSRSAPFSGAKLSIYY